MPERIARLMDKLGLKEGEVIQHSMVTSSIERAQKKVEENNFGIRKRLLEYDNVMNSQREVIYKRRRNALFGERLELDILTMLYDTCEDMVINAKNASDYESLRLNALSTLALDYDISKEAFDKQDQNKLTDDLYNKALEHYHKKNSMVATKALPIVRDIFKTRGATVENILVPFTDGKKQVGVAANLAKAVETNNAELIKSMEKMIALAIIDQLWKEHLREMDDLKQSVQNAVYEQKDPLLIYKFEGFEFFCVYKHFIIQQTRNRLVVENKQAFHQNNGGRFERDSCRRKGFVAKVVRLLFYCFATHQPRYIGSKIRIVDGAREVKMRHAVRVYPLLGVWFVIVVLRNEAQLCLRKICG